MNMAWNQKYGCFDLTKQLQIMYDVHDVYTLLPKWGVVY